MKKSTKLLTMLMSLMLTVLFMSGCAVSAYGAEMPEELKAVANKAVSIATNYAKQLDGAWGDQHAAMIDSKEGGAFAEFESMRAALCGFMAESDATYIYTLYPSGAVESAPFFLTVDGSEEADDYGTENEWEAGFAAAWKGTPTAGDHVWKDEGDGALLLSAYAPVHDSKGNVVAVLGVDYPAPEADKYPDWIF